MVGGLFMEYNGQNDIIVWIVDDLFHHQSAVTKKRSKKKKEETKSTQFQLDSDSSYFIHLYLLHLIEIYTMYIEMRGWSAAETSADNACDWNVCY